MLVSFILSFSLWLTKHAGKASELLPDKILFPDAWAPARSQAGRQSGTGPPVPCTALHYEPAIFYFIIILF